MVATVQCMDVSKILEAVVFVASKVQDPTFHKISKMFWFADKLHLQRYGFAVSDDTYHAMNDGPVPSRIYDILKLARSGQGFVVGIDSNSIKTAISVLGDGRTVAIRRPPNLDFLSESEVECLVDAITEHGHKSFGQLSDETHDSAWKSVPRNAAIPFREIVKTLPNAEELESFLFA
ncbi:MAG: Panacea domain-containing protein [Pseudomonadota bacterium]|nr:Panacea domain-containing protein [Pseudomonadota bacterium]